MVYPYLTLGIHQVQATELVHFSSLLALLRDQVQHDTKVSSDRDVATT